MSSSSASAPFAAPQAALNFCHGGGYIAAVAQPPPDEPLDYDVKGYVVRGCNQLRCRRCAARVRYVFNYKFRNLPTPTEVAALYGVPELASSPLLEPATARLYLCQCHAHQALESHALLGEPDAPEPDAAIFAVLVESDWACAGHPIATLPCRIDGIEVTPQNLRDLTVQALRGHFPPGVAERDRWPGIWVARLYLRLAQTPFQQVVAETVLASLSDPSAEARMAALHWLQRIELSGASQRALELLQGDRTLFAGVPDKTQSYEPQTLEQSLWRIAAPLCSQPGPARELAKQDALTAGRWNYTIYLLLAQTESEWVAAHIEALTHANPDGVAVLIQAIGHAMVDVANEPLREALIQWARQQVLLPGEGNKDLYALLARQDGMWMAAQMEELVRIHPQHIELLIETLDRHYRDPDPAAQQRIQDLLTQLVRTRLLSPGQGSTTLFTWAARNDPPWFAAHIDELVSANPKDLAAIVQAIRQRVPDVAVRLAQTWLMMPGKWNGELYRLLGRDHPQWFAAQAETLARKNPDSIPALIQAINNFPSRIPNSQALRDSLKAYAASHPVR